MNGQHLHKKSSQKILNDSLTSKHHLDVQWKGRKRRGHDELKVFWSRVKSTKFKSNCERLNIEPELNILDKEVCSWGMVLV